MALGTPTRKYTWMQHNTQADGSRISATQGVHNETYYSVVDVAVDSTTVSSVPALLFGVYVNTALSAHALPIVDGSTTIVTIPASAAAGSMYTFPGIRFETSLIVDPNDAATGNVTLAYRPL